jgi:transposase
MAVTRRIFVSMPADQWLTDKQNELKWGRHPVDVEPLPMPRFTVLRRRWVVERTFAWVGRYRRMSKDYE